ncbi:MAG: roadblock/LC7 domain-containing protein [Deltaproteobacteria bacterium]|nr:roadblock/LC7 domain-containing protein [Deltaproteobacteria bacterium]
MTQLSVLLEELVEISGIRTALVVGRDGLVVDSATKKYRDDDDAVGAIISTGICSIESTGKELNLGKSTQGLLEYSDGVVLINALAEDSLLVIVADKKVNLGNIRYQARKRMTSLQKAI